MGDIGQVQQNNPLLVTGGLPDFAAIEPKHVVPAVRSVLTKTEEQLRQLEETAEPTWVSTIERLEAIDHPIEYAWGSITHLFGVKNTVELREAYETVLGEVVQFELRMRQSQPIYDALHALKQSSQWASLTETQRRIIDKRLLSAQLGGIALEGQARDRFNQITQELSLLSKKFANNLLDATKGFALDLTEKSDIDGLPPSLLALTAQTYNSSQAEDSHSSAATPEEGPWQITLESTIYVPFIKHCRNRALRESIYRAYITRASCGEHDNTPLVEQTLILRREQAQLLGYNTYAEVSLAQKMADSVEDVEAMFETLRSASLDAAHADMQALQDLAVESGIDEPLNKWDIPFWAERLREKRFNYTDEEIRLYFPFEKVLMGLFDLAHRLFGITVRESEEIVSVWHSDVRFFKVFNETNQHIASFFLDPFSRPENKRGGAWMDICLVRQRVDGRIQLPVVHLICNNTPPVGDTPSLMTLYEVESLVHEFGHGLHHMLTIIDEADASGINGVEWDAVELPSQFLENWCYHKPTLQNMSGHFETGKPLPEDLFKKLKAAHTFHAGIMMLRQLQLAMTDMYLHHHYDPENVHQTVFDVQRAISEKMAILPMLPEDRFLCSFQHIFAGAYAAGYYSYKWAEVLSADAFGAFEEAGLEDASATVVIGKRFRDTILALGGSRHPMEIFKEFRGRQPTTEALLRHSGLLPAL